MKTRLPNKPHCRTCWAVLKENPQVQKLADLGLVDFCDKCLEKPYLTEMICYDKFGNLLPESEWASLSDDYEFSDYDSCDRISNEENLDNLKERGLL